MLLGVVITTIMVACKKESTSPNTNTNIDGIKISRVIINGYMESTLNEVDTLGFEYDVNGDVKFVTSSFGSISERQIDNYKYSWQNNDLKIVSNSDTSFLKFDNSKKCISVGDMVCEYKNEYLIKVGFKKGARFDNSVFDKDTFNIFIWENGNLVSNGAFNYEYYTDKLNNSFLNILPMPFIKTSNDDPSIPAELNNIDPFSLFIGGGFYQDNFGKSPINLIKRIYNEDESYNVNYKFDTNSRVIEMEIIGDVETIKYFYTWK